MDNMQNQKTLLRIFLSENDSRQSHPLYKQILKVLQEEHLAGATVLRGISGFGADCRMHDAHLLAISDDLPLVIEAVDEDTKIRQVLAKIDPMLNDCLVTLETVKIYKSSSKNRKPENE